MTSTVTRLAAAALILAAALAADAQPAAKTHRIGILEASPSAARAYLWEEFRQGLIELGYVEGRNIAIERRFADGQWERLPDLAAELVRLKVEVIVAAPTPAIRAVQQATTTIPIVMAISGDPVGTGFVASLARPAGNITGLSLMTSELVGKQLALLKEVVPNVSRVAVLWNPANPLGAPQLREAKVAAQALAAQLQVLEVRAPTEFDGAFAAMTRARAGALLVLPDAIFGVNRSQLADLAAKSRLPAMYGLREIVDAGGLMAYGPRYADLFRRAARYVDKILKGAKPADLPVEQPTKFELVINLKTAKTLAIPIPPSLRLRADSVIE